MNEEKQIEEMAKDLCVGLNSPYASIYKCKNCILYPALCDHRKSAEILYNEGYRKASEVLDEIERLIHQKASPITTMAFIETKEYKEFKRQCTEGI